VRERADTIDNPAGERLAELVSAACYGSVLVLAALSAVGISEIALGHGAEIVAGVGVATWLAHFFAEIVGGHVRHIEPLHRHQVIAAAVEGSPILGATVLPGLALLLGRVDVVSDQTARVTAMLIAAAQLFAIGAYAARAGPARRESTWPFALVTAGVGLVVVVFTVMLGH
jgi:hypothetical protein